MSFPEQKGILKYIGSEGEYTLIKGELGPETKVPRIAHSALSGDLDKGVRIKKIVL